MFQNHFSFLRSFFKDSNRHSYITYETFKANIASEPEEERLYHALLQKTLSNRDKFPRKGSRGPVITSAWGEESEYKHAPCFWISSSKFIEFLEDEGYKDVDYAAKLLAKANYIAKFGDRYKKKHAVGGVDTTCYALFKNVYVPVTKDKKGSAKPSRSNSNLTTLILDDPDDGDDTRGS